ncbi:phosphatidylinositol-specific phospholipase C domain-containing protein [bacterium]|nr:phosphatidylinositol-specific phospholipase C domain-containing protein [bacterium]
MYRATHNSYSGGPRRSLHDQLRAGVRCLELDVTHGSRRLAVSHGVTGHRVSRVGDNPVTNRLHDWLALIRRWVDDPVNAGHAPLVIVLDVKHGLASRGDRVSVSVLGLMCREIFADRIFSPLAADPAWPHVNEMRGKVLLVLSGDRKTRKRCLRDAGREPAVAANRTGGVIEVHRSHDGSALWYWAGTMLDGRPHWLWHDRYGRGITPAVALNDRGSVVAVSRAVGSDNIWYRLGRLGRDGRATWGRARLLARGRSPAVRFTSPGGRTVAVSYDAPGGGRRERRGGMKIADDRVDWRGAVASEDRRDHARAELPGGGELRIRSTNLLLQWSRDGGDWHRLIYAPLMFMEQQRGDDDWMTALGPHFAAAPAGRNAWARDRLAEGRIVRFWKFGRAHVSGAPVSFPATDTPHEAWYQAYAKTRGALA